MSRVHVMLLSMVVAAGAAAGAALAPSQQKPTSGWNLPANAADTKNSPVLSPDVPLTMDQLRQVAYSDVWFE